MGYITSISSNSPAQVGFEWGTTTTYGNTTTMKTFIAPGPFSTSITSLSPNTTYHFRAIAITLDTGEHTVYGRDLAFTTYAAAPHPKTTTSANLIWLWAIMGAAVITIVITLIIKRKNRRPIT